METEVPTSQSCQIWKNWPIGLIIGSGPVQAKGKEISHVDWRASIGFGLVWTSNRKYLSDTLPL